MPVAVLDASPLIAEYFPDDQYHDLGEEVVEKVSSGELPEMVVPYPMLQEVLKKVDKADGWQAKVEYLRWFGKADSFRVGYPTEQDVNDGFSVVGTFREFEVPDGIAVAFMRNHDYKYIYSFDGKFDDVPDISLQVKSNPYAP